MTLDDECQKKIELNYNKYKLSLKSLPRFYVYNSNISKSRDNYFNNNNIINNNELKIIREENKNNLTKEEGDVDFDINSNRKNLNNINSLKNQINVFSPGQ